MHHPVRFDPPRGSSFVEDERLLQANAPVSFRRVDRPIRSGGFPESSARDSVRPRAVPVLAVPRTVEVPFFLPGGR